MPLSRHDRLYLEGIQYRQVLLEQFRVIKMKAGPVAATDRRNSIEPGEYFAQSVLASFVHSHTHPLKQKNKVKHPPRERAEMTGTHATAS